MIGAYLVRSYQTSHADRQDNNAAIEIIQLAGLTLAHLNIVCPQRRYLKEIHVNSSVLANVPTWNTIYCTVEKIQFLHGSCL